MGQSCGLVFLDGCPCHSLSLPPQGHCARAQMSWEEPGATSGLCWLSSSTPPLCLSRVDRESCSTGGDCGSRSHLCVGFQAEFLGLCWEESFLFGSQVTSLWVTLGSVPWHQHCCCRCQMLCPGYWGHSSPLPSQRGAVRVEPGCPQFSWHFLDPLTSRAESLGLTVGLGS